MDRGSCPNVNCLPSKNETWSAGVANTWAIVECAGSPPFTHLSFDDFHSIRDNLASGLRATAGRLVPYCMFVDPPLARVGITESEARERGVHVRVAKLATRAIVRTRTTSENVGFLKALVDDCDRIAAFAMIGPEAGEVMESLQATVMASLPYTALRDAVLTHPTMAEGLNAPFGNVPVIG